MQQLPLGVRLRERATFATFVAGANVEACVRLRAIAAGAGGILWLWGASGSGRTHLLQACCAASTRRAAYLPLAELPVPGADVLEGGERTTLLCLDDLDARLGDHGFERGLFSIYRSVEERGAALVVTAAAAPASLSWALADIGSRFGACEVFQLRPLDEAGELAALRLRAAGRGLDLPEDTALYLLRRFPRDMHALGRLLDEMDVASLTAQRRLTVPFVRAILGDP